MIENLRLKQDTPRSVLVDHAITNEGAKFTSTGVLTVETGSRTGRSVKDRYIVVDDVTESSVSWGKTSQPYSKENMHKVWDLAMSYAQDLTLFSSFLQVGADKKYGLRIHAITEYAWHQLFARNIFIREVMADLSNYSDTWTLISLPGMQLNAEDLDIHSEAGLFIDFENKRVLLSGLRYAGEMKKSMFSVLNFLLPSRGVLPMHCAANMDDEGDVALFFGLSGTGKTTLSADPKRKLIGDDEHGWSSDGVFNFEGGCYAKCINLSEQSEPMIWHATRQPTAILENVTLDANQEPQFADTSLTTNTRAVYPRDVVPNIQPNNRGGIPSSVIFLTCDLYGVLPPVSVLSVEQARYWFLNGYTALVGSTEVGSTKTIQSTFSTCFGAAFFPQHPTVYADLLQMRLEASAAQVYLVNTGWSGGSYTSGGKRFAIDFTRMLLDRILDGTVLDAEMGKIEGFDLRFPMQVPGLDSNLLDPRKSWSSQSAYNEAYQELFKSCNDNYQQYIFKQEDAAVVASA
ncbi:MAG: phosphoenolpyruvate carboxykinase (ATP) [Pseudomonadota bacterium]|nr:phosphoenolpyruvate carboxykinase (ATP) [Pseudomonadota bacterium]